MKLKYILSVITGIAIGLTAAAQSRMINLDADKTPITAVFDKIKNAATYNILYSDEIVSDTMLVSYTGRDIPVSFLLDSILPPKGLFYTLRPNDMIVIGNGTLRKQGINMAYATTKLQGSVVDDKDNAVPYATISLAAQGHVLTDIVCDEKGYYAFSFPMEAGHVYQLQISSAEFEPGQINFTYPDSLSIKKKVLRRYNGKLAGVTITAAKQLIERKIDRVVFNVENSVALTGGDALDALRITPGVHLQGNSISLSGKSTVRIMVNDKMVQLSGDDLLNYLKNIPTATIEKIEVITNPPAKYDAEGNSGIINIRLKKAKEDNWNTTLRAAGTQATYASGKAGIGLSYKQGKLSLLTDLSYNRYNDIYTNDIHYQYPAEHWHNFDDNKNRSYTFGSLLNMQYQASDKKSVGIQYTGFFSKKNTAENPVSKSYNNDVLLKDYKTSGTDRMNAKNIAANINYTQKINDNGKMYSVDADFFNYTAPKYNQFISVMNDYTIPQLMHIYGDNNSDQHIKNYSLKTDITWPAKIANLSMGAKESYTKTKSLVAVSFKDMQADTFTSRQHDNFQYTEHTQAAYISAAKDFGRKIAAKAGLRAEYTGLEANSISTGSDTKNRYFKLFPTAYFLYKINKDHSISINFGRRINRPSFGELNPARWYFSATTYGEGNPFLQPSFYYNYEINYAYKSHINLNLSMGKIKNGYSQITYHDLATENVIFKRLNYFNGIIAAADLNISYAPFSFWDFYADANYSYNKSNPFIDILHDKLIGSTTLFTFNNNFRLNKQKTLLASLNFYYMPAGINKQYHFTASSGLDAGFKALLLKKKLTAGINFEDIFKDNPFTISFHTQGIYQTYRQYYDTRLMRLSLSYNFGNQKINVTSRKVGNQEEKNRSN